MNSEVIIEIRNLRKRYGSTVALDNVSLKIGKGITGLVGPNGAGKTTLINIITGLIDADGGEVKIGIEGDFRRRIGVIRDRIAFPPELEVRYFLERIAELYRVSSNRVRDVIKLVGLEEVTDKRIGALSRGYKKRVGIAQAVLHEPVMVIADEPFAQLDPIIKVEIRDIIAKLSREHGVNFFISSHEIEDLERIADRVVLINRGRVVRIIKRGGRVSVVVESDNNDELVTYLIQKNLRARMDRLRVRVEIDNLKNLLRILGEYEGNIYSVNMSSIEGVMKDEFEGA
ncbi:MAG: ABC transporter ATP-binding protein [Thermoplasmata archaeon]|nr:ABC transporter ATP-binding protein [Thermoplasmata archaeon]